MYYASTNSYATDTSVGFSNTWKVIGFATRAMRDAYVANAVDMATQGIKAADMRSYGAKRGHVDYYDANGVYWMHISGDEFFRTLRSIDPTTARLVTNDEGFEVRHRAN